MSEAKDWVVFCPSFNRSKTIGDDTFRLLPDILYAVHEAQVKDYVKDAGIPEKQIIPLKSLGLTNQLAEVMNRLKEYTVVRIDDDLKKVTSIVGQKPRTFDKQDDILQIIENNMMVSRDLGTSLFHWGLTKNPIWTSPYDPLSLYRDIPAGIYGINGRSLKYDTNLTAREDFDIALQCLLKDRFFVKDCRFMFDFGGISSHAGGLQTYRNAEQLARDNATIKAKWGRFVSVTNPKKPDEGKMSTYKFSRANPLATLR